MKLLTFFVIVQLFSIVSIQAKDFVISAIDGSQNFPHLTNMIKIISQAYREIGITPKWKYYPSQRALQMANSGEVDATGIRAKSTPLFYPALRTINVPLLKSHVGIYTRKGETIHKKDFDKYRIGVLRGTIFALLDPKYKFIPFDSPKKTVELLLKKRIDAIIADDLAAQAYIKKLKLNSQIQRSGKFSTVSLFHHVHKKHETIIPSLEEKLKKLLSQNNQ